MKRVELVVLDLDGTTIEPKGDAVPTEDVIAAVEQTRARGIPVAVATGRPVQIAWPALLALGHRGPGVFNGGSETWDVWGNTRQPLDSQRLQPAQLGALGRAAASFGRFLMCEDDEHTRWSVVPPEPTEAIGKAVMHGVPTDYLDKRLATLRSAPDVTAAPTTSWTVEGAMDIHVTHALASKYHGVQRLMRLYGASPETTLVFGDSDNDLPMLAAVDRNGRVGMANGTPAVLTAAAHIAPAQSDDGVAAGLHELVLR